MHIFSCLTLQSKLWADITAWFYPLSCQSWLPFAVATHSLYGTTFSDSMTINSTCSSSQVPLILLLTMFKVINLSFRTNGQDL